MSPRLLVLRLHHRCHHHALLECPLYQFHEFLNALILHNCLNTDAPTCIVGCSERLVRDPVAAAASTTTANALVTHG